MGPAITRGMETISSSTRKRRCLAVVDRATTLFPSRETVSIFFFSSLFINSLAMSAFYLCDAFFNAMDTILHGGLGMPLVSCVVTADC